MPVPLPGRAEQSDPVQRRADPGPGGARVGSVVGGVEAGQVVLAGQDRVERGPLDQGSDARQRGRCPAGIGTPSSSACPLVAKARPSSSRIVVVFPEPLGPRKPYTEPRGTARLT